MRTAVRRAGAGRRALCVVPAAPRARRAARSRTAARVRRPSAKTARRSLAACRAPDPRCTTNAATDLDAELIEAALRGEDGEDGPAPAAFLDQPFAIALGSDHALYVTHGNGLDDGRIARISTADVGFGADSLVVASPDHGELWAFTAQGRHLATLWTFGYDEDGRLETIADTYAAVTTIERDGNGCGRQRLVDRDRRGQGASRSDHDGGAQGDRAAPTRPQAA